MKTLEFVFFKIIQRNGKCLIFLILYFTFARIIVEQNCIERKKKVLYIIHYAVHAHNKFSLKSKIDEFI